MRRQGVRDPGLSLCSDPGLPPRSWRGTNADANRLPQWLPAQTVGPAMLTLSIILEAVVAVMAVLAARQGRPYLYGLAFTFAAYVIYDLARALHWAVEGPVLSWLFLLATVSALVAVVGLWWRGRH